MTAEDAAPAHDIAAEQAALGGMLLDRDVVADVAAVLRPADCYRPAHQMIFQAILNLDGRGDPCDPVAVAALLAQRGELDRCGGPVYLHDLIAAVPVAANAGYYARIAAGKAVLRRLGEAATTIAQMASQAADEPEAIHERARALVESAAPPPRDRPQYIAELFAETAASLESEAARGMPTPLADLTTAIAGAAPGQLIVIGGRPRSGKSVLGLQWAAHAAIRLRAPALFESLEMPPPELMMRLIAAEARVPMNALTGRRLGEREWGRIRDAAPSITEAPLAIRAGSRVTPALIRAHLRDMDPPAALVVVDYLQILAEPAQAESRQAAVAHNARALKDLAMEFSIPVVALAQLNRGAQGRPPQLEDLRESGEIENAADVVILIHRPDLADLESPRAGEVDLLVEKNRQGPRCVVTAAFQGHYARIVDITYQPEPERWSPSGVLEKAAS